MKSTKEDLQSVLEKLINEIIKYIDDLNNPNEALFTSDEDFNHETFLKNLDNEVSLITKNAATFSISAKPPCEPNDVIEICKMYQRNIETFVTIIESLPFSQGKNFNEEIRSVGIDILRSIATLFNEHLESKKVNLDSIKSIQGPLVNTGMTWYNCNIMKQISKNNLECCTKKIRTTLEFISDAMAEIKDASENQNDFDDFDVDSDEEEEEEKNERELTDQEKEVIANVLNLYKLSNLLLKKVMTRTMRRYEKDDSAEANQWLDNIANIAGSIFSEASDNLACSAMEYPLDLNLICDNCDGMIEKAAEIIDICINISNEKDVKWFNICKDQYQKFVNVIKANNASALR